MLSLGWRRLSSRCVGWKVGGFRGTWRNSSSVSFVPFVVDRSRGYSSSSSGIEEKDTVLEDLYARIMNLHQTQLPEGLRSLGDTYVKEEFAKHQSVTDPTFRSQFIEGWEQYAKQLEAEAEEIGRDLTETELLSLNDDQKAKLGELRNHSQAVKPSS